MQRSVLIVCLVSACLLLNCCVYIKTLPMHDPIYPTPNDKVTYSLEASANKGIKTIRLYEQLSDYQPDGTWHPRKESLIDKWPKSGSLPSETCISHTRTDALPKDVQVRYRFEVVDKKCRKRSHEVTYAVNPYPVADSAAPAYVQRVPDGAFDVVFIPDQDITDLTTFYGHCRGMIRDAMFADSVVRFYSRQFNFYINPYRGTTIDYAQLTCHLSPANASCLDFAECWCLMHAGSLRDCSYRRGDDARLSYFSTVQQCRSIMLHEAGHAMFGLSDEYAGNDSKHEQCGEWPNNWESKTAAETAAPHRHKTAADARPICADAQTATFQSSATFQWYKLCKDSCQMCVAGDTVPLTGYDAPCEDRVAFAVEENAGSHCCLGR
jgi:hypothetical protein